MEAQKKKRLFGSSVLCGVEDPFQALGGGGEKEGFVYMVCGEVGVGEPPSRHLGGEKEGFVYMFTNVCLCVRCLDSKQSNSASACVYDQGK